MPDCGPGFYELVAGARRYRASKLAGRESIPATIRELTDSECLELQLIENLQRADVHELDEARGYAALMRLQPENYTAEVLAEKIGRSQKYVYARLRLLHLIEDAQEAFYLGKLTVAHAFEIARLQLNDQRRALQECFPNHRSTASALKDRKAEPVTVRGLRAWIESEVHLDLSHAAFDPEDATLVPSAGSCAKCPKRTGNNPLLFPEVQRKSTCTDPDCYRVKVEALVQIRVKPLEAKGEKPLRISHVPGWQAHSRKADVLYDGQYRTVKKAECPQTKPAVVIDGREAGNVVHVCRDEKCPVHAHVSNCKATPQERAARAKELLAERIEKKTRVRILDAIRKKLPATLPRPDMENRHFRQVLFLCDEYQHFATVGESDPTGDEKFFSLSRQAKCIPIVATQSISSLRSALPGDSWRTLLQTFRTKIFLCLSDDFSAKTASELCGREDGLKVSYNLSESGHDASVSLLTGKAVSHRANITASKSYNTQTDFRFDMKTFTELRNAQSITIAYDGLNPIPPTFCYLKPYYNEPNKSYFEQLAAGEL